MIEYTCNLLLGNIDTQLRDHEDSDTIKYYADLLNDAGEYCFPPIDVGNVEDDKKLYIIDGFHRCRSASMAFGCDFEIPVNITTYKTFKDLRWDNIAANKTNGLSRTNADKKKAVYYALINFADLSDRAIAKQVGVSNNFVTNERKRLVEIGTLNQPTAVKGADGKKYKTKPKLICDQDLEICFDPDQVVPDRSERAERTYSTGKETTNLEINDRKQAKIETCDQKDQSNIVKVRQDKDRQDFGPFCYEFADGSGVLRLERDGNNYLPVKRFNKDSEAGEIWLINGFQPLCDLDDAQNSLDKAVSAGLADEELIDLRDPVPQKITRNVSFVLSYKDAKNLDKTLIANGIELSQFVVDCIRRASNNCYGLDLVSIDSCSGGFKTT